MNARWRWKPPDKNANAHGQVGVDGETELLARTDSTSLPSRLQRLNAAPCAPKPVIPEYGASWHAFVAWAVGQGHAPPQRMVDTIVDEIEAETT
jgi:hypothetical protein